MTKTIDPTDAHVGKMLRTIRLAADFSQTDLGDMIGVQFQQIQKYETGRNRISASRLKAAANALGVHVEAFFEGIDGEQSRKRAFAGVMGDPDALRAAAAIYALPPSMRQSLLDILDAMTASLPKPASAA